MAESADATDLKSVDGDIVWVRPPLALLIRPRKEVFFYFINRKIAFNDSKFEII